ncbi:MAG: RelA/SpoT family protein [Candidatus Magasanikbacteria bacterium]|nr:RelA/SpoT family protein [Candidatus Magasanikbacteria bacterium]
MKNQIVLPKNVSLDSLIDELKKYCVKSDLEMVRLAYDFAADAHKGQLRFNGEPYIIHPLTAAFILALMRIDISIIIAALLHDVPEDTGITLDEIEKKFGQDVANMVKGITKLGKLKYRGVERYLENLRKMFVAMAEDIRVMIIKFADRIHNLLTLEAQPPNKQYRIALESLEIYAPIANRLGMGEFKGILEDLSFKYVFPKEYEKVKELSDATIAEEGPYLEKIMVETKNELKKAGLKVIDIHGRKKKLYSFFQKLKQRNWEVDQIHDIVAVRVLVPEISDCYAALGIIHKLWRPLKGRIKDFISQPKPNGYKSLHTTVFCDDGRVVEFQIRTLGMHEEAEFGIAAHWHYDEKKGPPRASAKDVGWAKELARIQKEVLNNLSDLDSLKIDFFQNRIFVFTPNGDVIDLPENATPVDFAYHIHTDIGNKCNGSLVNDQMVSLDTALRSGDVVEVIVDKNRKGPSRDWLKFVKTHVAKQHIRQYFNTQKKHWLATILPMPLKK